MSIESCWNCGFYVDTDYDTNIYKHGFTYNHGESERYYDMGSKLTLTRVTEKPYITKTENKKDFCAICEDCWYELYGDEHEESYEQ